MADVAGFAARKAEAAKRGKLRGLGYSSYIEACGLAPSNVAGALGARAGLFEAGEVRVNPTGGVTVFTGSHSHGQGHETTFAQIVAGAARHRHRQRRGRARRHRTHPVRHGHLRLAVAGGRRHGDRQGARQGRSPRARRSRRTCSRPRKPTSSSRTASSPWPAPTAARRSPKWRSPRTCRTTIRSTSWSRASTKRRSTTRPTSPIPRARTSARSRSIRTPAW